jgi:hypothetical protein
MWLFQQVARFRLPPQVIVDAAVPESRHGGPALAEEHRQFLAVTSHVGFGLGNGIVLAIVHRAIGFRRPIALGVAYGVGLYTVSYAGVVPAVGVLPAPHRDNRGRQLALAAAHVAYGAAAGQVLLRLSRD